MFTVFDESEIDRLAENLEYKKIRVSLREVGKLCSYVKVFEIIFLIAIIKYFSQLTNPINWSPITSSHIALLLWSFQDGYRLDVFLTTGTVATCLDKSKSQDPTLIFRRNMNKDDIKKILEDPYPPLRMCFNRISNGEKDERLYDVSTCKFRSGTHIEYYWF